MSKDPHDPSTARGPIDAPCRWLMGYRGITFAPLGRMTISEVKGKERIEEGESTTILEFDSYPPSPHS